MNESTQNARVVEEALRTYPLKPAPPNLLPDVMMRVRAQSHAPRFRLGWLDWAATLFVACMTGLFFFVLNSIPPQVAAYIESELALRAQTARVPNAIILVVIGLLAGCMLLLAARLFARQRWG